MICDAWAMMRLESDLNKLDIWLFYVMLKGEVHLAQQEAMRHVR
jgi:hypothetical protein